MKNWVRKIYVNIYDSSVIPTTVPPKWDIRDMPAVVKNDIMEISLCKLCLCTAKSIITRTSIYRREVVAFARSYFVTIPFLIAEKDGFIALNYDNKGILRDFSKTSRLGELAQGLNYYFALDNLNACGIQDFDIYWDENVNQKYSGRKPDYVLIYQDGNIGLLESKGTGKANPSSSILSGNKQCEDGKKNLNTFEECIKNAYVSAVSFGTSSKSSQNTRYSTLYCVGSSNNDFDTVEEKLAILGEYAKWFYLAGDEENYKNLLKVKNCSIEGKPNYYGTVIAEWQIDEGCTIQMGITQPLKEFLLKLDEVAYLELKQQMRNDARIEDKAEIFSDGTFILINDNHKDIG